MDRVNYIELFSIPEDYKQPDDNELSTNTDYPNLNSREYRKKPVESNPKLKPFLETFDMYEGANILLACNDIRGRIWNGCIYGFKKFDDIKDESKANFKLLCDSPFLAAQMNGFLELWSTHSKVRQEEDYCLFMLGGKCEHIGIILAMETLVADDTKAVTGSNDCCLKMWDIGTSDLCSIHTINMAHSDSITGISSSNGSEPIFVTCSRDKSALIWDYRLPRPAISLLEDHKFGFTTIHWTKPEEKNEHIFIGDETGKILEVDPLVPNIPLREINAFNRPIRKIKFSSNNMAVCGNSNIIKIFRKDDSDNYDIVYKDSQAKNFIRDICWDYCSPNELLTVGWDSHMSRHSLSE